LKVEESGFDSKKKKRQKVSLHRHIHTGCGVKQDFYPMSAKCFFLWK